MPVPAAPKTETMRGDVVAKFAAIDVGTNSIHLVMCEISPDGDFRILGREKQMVQLGKGGFVRHILTARAMNDGLATLRRFIKMAYLKEITRLKAVATSAVREARNGGEFVRRVRDELGLDLHVISAEEEARLIYLGVRHAVDLGHGDNLILDIGGGSLEIVVGNASKADVVASLKLGASRLAEVYLREDPATSAELKALRGHIEASLEPLAAKIGRRRLVRCIATSGTIQNVATVCAYRRGTQEIEPVTRLRIDRSEAKCLVAELGQLSRADRAKIPGIDGRRVDAILPAAMLLHVLMRTFDVTEVEHCDMALREGAILDYISRHRARLRARATWPDPRMRSVYQLGERCNWRRAHAEQVAKLALSLFDQLGDLHGLEARYRELLRYACLLHDVGYLISHQSHHKHSYYLIRNGGLQGFIEAEIEMIANLARYHRKGWPKKSHYSYQNVEKPDRAALRRLIPVIRLANALDRTHYSVVDSIGCRIGGRRVRFSVRTNKDAELELWTAAQHAGTFEKEYGMSIEIAVAQAAATEDGNERGE
jgi:exopolyphosphatase/guanosine-5'-triphosphate,3'-diphosphate pyrophosphatase